MATRVFVDGQEGTTGLRIHEYLARRSDVEVLRAAPELRKDAAERARLLNAADVAFLCLPDAAAREAAALVTNPPTCLIDASTAHRTAQRLGLRPARARRRPARAHPRLQADRRTRAATATGFILLVRPLVDAGLVPSTALLSATSITGYSGGGKKMIEQYEAGGDPRLDVAAAVRAQARATSTCPRWRRTAGSRRAPVFMPIVGNFLKGLSVARAAAPGDAQARHDGRRSCTRRWPSATPASASFASCRCGDEAALDDGYFDVQACNDTNRVDLFVFASDDPGAADVPPRQPRQGRERRRGAVDERAPRPRRRRPGWSSGALAARLRRRPRPAFDSGTT